MSDKFDSSWQWPTPQNEKPWERDRRLRRRPCPIPGAVAMFILMQPGDGFNIPRPDKRFGAMLNVDFAEDLARIYKLSIKRIWAIQIEGHYHSISEFKLPLHDHEQAAQITPPPWAWPTRRSMRKARRK